MKHYKKAFSIPELTVCILVMMILSFFAVSNIKPTDNKTRLSIYSAVNNLASVVGTIVTNNSNLDNFDLLGNTDNDKLCMQIADFYSLNTTANCSRNTGYDVVNIVFPSGITIKGLAQYWITDDKISSAGENYKFKEIEIDINGNSGLNKVGIDRFPFRIYRKGVLEGSIVPVDCSLSNVESYCQNNEISTNINLTTTADFISYDIYRAKNIDSTTADIKAVNKSFVEADCGTYGGLGYFTPSECSEYNKNVILECANKEICDKCNTEGVNICPEYQGGQLTSETCKEYINENNPDNISCIMLVHKPPIGGGLIVDTVLDSIDE